MNQNNTLSKFIIFAVGAAIGSAVTWKFVKTKYERIAQEEIEDVKRKYSKRAQEDDQLEKIEEAAKNAIGSMQRQLVIDEFASIADKEGYTNYASVKDAIDVDKPYVIPPEQYDELDDYDAVELTYYADKVLAYYNGEIIDEEDAEEMVGLDSLARIGEDEEDSVHVRNDALKCDYEILLDLRKYSDVYIQTSPHQAEV